MTPLEPSQPTIQSDASAKAVLNKLKSRLRGFTVEDVHGEAVAKVYDLIPDPASSKGYFNVVLSQFDLPPEEHLLLLNSKFLRRVDFSARSLITSLDKIEFNNLPNYKQPVSLEEALSDPLPIANNSMSESTDDSTAPIEHNSQVALPALTQLNDGQDTTAGVGNSLQISSLENLPQETIQLLEERLRINRGKRKVGEIIVRKEIETRIVEVPVRREKLIVEQVGEEHKRLAEIDIGTGEISGIDFAEINLNRDPIVSGEFDTLESAIHVLDAIAKTVRHRCKQVKLELMFDDREMQRTYHEFTSPKAAKRVLELIATVFYHSYKKARIELVLEDVEIQKTYQEWFEQYK